MTPQELNKHAEEIVASLDFAWLLLKPELLQTFQTLAVQTIPDTAHIHPPIDGPITNVDSGITLHPSEMQRYFLSSVIPMAFAGLQSIAEDALNDHFGDSPKISSRLHTLRTNGTIDANLANDAQHWRLVRNVVIHGNGAVSAVTQGEAASLFAAGQINFTEFALWGPLLDAGHGGTLVPLTAAAFAAPNAPGAAAKRTPILAGQQIAIGLADMLACARVWARLIEACNIGAPNP